MAKSKRTIELKIRTSKAGVDEYYRPSPAGTAAAVRDTLKTRKLYV